MDNDVYTLEIEENQFYITKNGEHFCGTGISLAQAMKIRFRHPLKQSELELSMHYVLDDSVAVMRIVFRDGDKHHTVSMPRYMVEMALYNESYSIKVLDGRLPSVVCTNGFRQEIHYSVQEILATQNPKVFMEPETFWVTSDAKNPKVLIFRVKVPGREEHVYVDILRSELRELEMRELASNTKVLAPS